MSPSSGSADLVHLRAAGVSLVLDVRGRLPAVVHWGHDLGDLDADDLAALATVGVPSTVPNDLDEAAPFCALLPEHSSGWNGRPGLRGSRSGRGWSPQFVLTGFQPTTDPAGGGRIVATGVDEVAGLTLVIELELLPSGLAPLMRALTDAGLVALTSQPPTLEDLFLRHYGAAVPVAAAGSSSGRTADA